MALGFAAKNISSYIVFVVIEELLCGVISAENFWYV